MAIKLQSGQIPQNSGVYFFSAKGGPAYGGKNKILYIGKAANLRARLRSRILPKEIGAISWEVLRSEAEALIREAELIKKYRPKFNVLMRDDKQYFYVGFSKEKFPKIFITHQKQRRADYIGPFTEGGALRSVLKTLRRAFPYCTCKEKHKRPCLNARIGRCLGYCCLTPTPRRIVGGLPLRKGEKLFFSPPFPLTKGEGGEVVRGYQKNIRAIKQILSGKNKSLTRGLKKDMRRLSDARKYEEAGEIRDQIRALENIFAHRGVIKQDISTEFAKALQALESILGISDIDRIEAYDIANIHGRFAYGSMAVFADGKIKKDDYRVFKIKTVRGSNDPAMLKEVLERRLKHKEWQYPEVIVIDGGKPQMGAVSGVLSTAQVLQDLAQRDGASRAIREHVNMRVLAKSSAKTIKIIALTKNKKHIGDHIFIQNHREPISLEKLPEPLKNLLLMLDSEAHRFAISHYRRLHRKRLLT